jgi:hypothetical protein
MIYNDIASNFINGLVSVYRDKTPSFFIDKNGTEYYEP